ncbi:hypothetical protein N7457_004094 [Penicillium paradoxum]|uniref:uncharacterized protein n=1 Tax=Penicillium paradoxum TaxID=176176 RepID=UPI0025473688|nr:uncharacterized protein N7457_004094 [Penicillium paradoxum]KAJ5782320.1 hypothetical protein N7457_004094 [Penicillium paradoxum]
MGELVSMAAQKGIPSRLSPMLAKRPVEKTRSVIHAPGETSDVNPHVQDRQLRLREHEAIVQVPGPKNAVASD